MPTRWTADKTTGTVDFSAKLGGQTEERLSERGWGRGEEEAREREREREERVRNEGGDRGRENGQKERGRRETGGERER